MAWQPGGEEELEEVVTEEKEVSGRLDVSMSSRGVEGMEQSFLRRLKNSLRRLPKGITLPKF